MAGRIIAIVILKEFNRKVFSRFHSLVKILELAVLRGREVLQKSFKERPTKFIEII